MTSPICALPADMNGLLNRPEIFDSFFSGTGMSSADFVIDMSGFYLRQGNVALACDGAIMLFPEIAHGHYDSHFIFPPECRGRRGLEAARQMLREMFTRYEAGVIEGSPPRENRAVRVFGTRLGYTPTGGSFTDQHGRECLEYRLTRDRFFALHGD